MTMQRRHTLMLCCFYS